MSSNHQNAPGLFPAANWPHRWADQLSLPGSLTALHDHVVLKSVQLKPSYDFEMLFNYFKSSYWSKKPSLLAETHYGQGEKTALWEQCQERRLVLSSGLRMSSSFSHLSIHNAEMSATRIKGCCEAKSTLVLKHLEDFSWKAWQKWNTFLFFSLVQ